MNTYRLTIQYDGARYKGWQRLGRDSGGPTIQSKIEAVISSLCGEDILVTGSGRTDAGVHALGQVAHFRCEAALDLDEILDHANRYLPDDIAVIAAAEEDPRFHARYHVKEKHYLYRIDPGAWPNPFERKYAWHIPVPLDVESMERAGGKLLGHRDFAGFCSKKSKKKSSEKTLSKIDIAADSEPKGGIMTIRLAADGFLHNMVRIIVGTLVDIGRGDLSEKAVDEALRSGDRKFAGTTAPAKGLFLEKVVY